MPSLIAFLFSSSSASSVCLLHLFASLLLPSLHPRARLSCAVRTWQSTLPRLASRDIPHKKGSEGDPRTWAALPLGPRAVAFTFELLALEAPLSSNFSSSASPSIKMPFKPSLPNNGHPSLPPLPLYTPSANPETASLRSYRSSAPSYSSACPPSYSQHPRRCSPPLPRTQDSEPSLSLFRRPRGSLSSAHHSHNPQARAYHNIAARRASSQSIRDQNDLLAAGAHRDPVKAVKSLVQIREIEEFGCEVSGIEGRRLRPLEDPELVGEEAADRARRDRLRREGDEVLIREDKRWDWMLAQMNDWEVREKSWKKFRETSERKRMERLGEVLVQTRSQLARTFSRD